MQQIVFYSINRALYHDFGPSGLPKMLLMKDLHQAGYSEMVGKCEQGEYDF